MLLSTAAVTVALSPLSAVQAEAVPAPAPHLAPHLTPHPAQYAARAAPAEKVAPASDSPALPIKRPITGPITGPITTPVNPTDNHSINALSTPANVPPVQAAAPASPEHESLSSPVPAPADTSTGALVDRGSRRAKNNRSDRDIIVVTGQAETPQEDPLQRVNEETFEAMQKVDAALVEPIADGYEKGLPRPLRKGVSNFFANLREPIVFLNFLLQGKPQEAVETLGRFAVNSTLGIAGIRDVARKEPFSLTRRKNGFAYTLGYYGVDTGPILVLPLVGMTTLRDIAGGGVDALVIPTTLGSPFNSPAFGITATTTRALDERIELREKLDAINESTNPYGVARAVYLCEKQAVIEELHNRPKPDCRSYYIIEDIEDDPYAYAAITPAAASQAFSQDTSLWDPSIPAITPSIGQPVPTPDHVPASPQ